VANTLNLFRNGAVGFIDWLDGLNSQIDNVLTNNLPLPADTPNNISVKGCTAPTYVARFRVVTWAHPDCHITVRLPRVNSDVA
jgi:hypothetical protein